ncbi:MAG: hypothetical protein KDK66_01970 [Deltaproteobacteria bacterium]|nr:hypothetical protein [Deltaproteobacteria bacterium]
MPAVNPAVPNHLSSVTPPPSPEAQLDQLKKVLSNPEAMQKMSTKELVSLLKLMHSLEKQIQQQQKPQNQQGQENQKQVAHQEIPPKLAAELPKLIQLATQTLQQKQSPESKTPQNQTAASQLVKNLLPTGGQLTTGQTSALMANSLAKAMGSLSQSQNNQPTKHPTAAIHNSAQLAQLSQMLQNPQAALKVLTQIFNLSSANTTTTQAALQTLSQLAAQGQKLPPSLQGLVQLANQALQAFGQPGQSLAQAAGLQPQALNALLSTIMNQPQALANLSKGLDQSMMLFSQPLMALMILAQPTMVTAGNEAMLQALAAMFAMQKRRMDQDPAKDKSKKKKLFNLDGTALVADAEEDEEEDFWEEEEESKQKNRSA